MVLDLGKKNKKGIFKLLALKKFPPPWSFYLVNRKQNINGFTLATGQTTSCDFLFLLARIFMRKKKRIRNFPQETTAVQLLETSQEGPRRAALILRLKEMSYENKLENYVRK